MFLLQDNCTAIQPLDIPTIEAPICDKTKKLKRRSFKAAKDKWVFIAHRIFLFTVQTKLNEWLMDDEW